MHKAYQFDGQFYVRKVNADQDTVPVDNFIFITTKGIEVKLATVGCQTVVSWHFKNKFFGHEYFDTKAQALRRFADILEGRVDVEDFGKQPD